ncbi:hypothetical protein SAMN04488698_11426 [Candidatus Frackibacter sp. WG12]|nr:MULTISPECIES: hypothetical protein [unclassified Candidatus Frackibacter]KXS42427.1 MAG: hypothetical protein AWU54_1329 [Candidatus Frackibacter sp. T328-2]SDC31332.1 hypothetical protein SAMN04515661_10691 [Candidatus Frackibacter sp. WG11]SEM73517.1 hypothetical protein SAMN04488698_11426 [Candidatus Frackibacter sp. WG12]SFL59205.1 hypothetical protein SAMN04488699_10690 [Candidatus Frackibacter sp. WG13]
MITKLKLKEAKLKMRAIKYCRRCGIVLTDKELNRSQFVCNRCMIEQLERLKNL